MDALLTLALASVVLGLAAGFAPGPLLALVIGESLRHGWRAGFLVAVAPLVTDVPIVLVTLAIVAHFGNADLFVGAVALAGAGFLIHLGVEGIRVRPRKGLVAEARARPFRKGLITNALNPNTYLFWLTVGAAYLLEAWRNGLPHVGVFLVAMYGAFIASKTLVGWLAARSRAFLGSRGFLWTNRALGVALLIFAVRFLWLAFERLGPFAGVHAHTP